MRNSVMLALAVPFALVSCGHADRVAAGNDVSLQRDLKLAATSSIDLDAPRVNPANFDRLETVPLTELREAKRLRKGSGPKAVASKAADLRATEIPEAAATDNVPQVETVAQAPSPIANSDPVASVPRPSDAPRDPGRVGAGDYGPRGQGGGVFGGIGPIIGVVIRGGGVDGDHCEPHGRGRTPGVYLPEPGGYGGTSRFPMFPHGGRP